MEQNNLKDHFSEQAEAYSKFRPTYPDRLFQFLASISPTNKIAWDCATGSGQAAVKLADYFESVVATDASEKQIENAIQQPKIIYKVASAEKTDFRKMSVDLITAAQALHWFNINDFYKEVKRVLKPEGIIAVWFYQLPQISYEVDKIISHFYHEIVGKYWPPERKAIDTSYQLIPFPFEKIIPPQISMQTKWNVETLIGYLTSWSAVQNYKQERGQDPIDLIKDQLLRQFSSGNEVIVNWPLTIWAG